MDTNTPPTIPLATLIEAVEKDLLMYIIINLRSHKLTPDEAKKLAKDFLALLPVSDSNELFEKLRILGQTYPEASAVYIKYTFADEEEKRNFLLTSMHNSLQKGNIDEAIAIAKGEKK